MSVYTGIDWSAKKHDIVILNEAGAIITRLTIGHQAVGFEELDKMRCDLSVRFDECLVGMETAHNVLIDFLWGRGYSQVYVIPPTVVKSSRGPYGSSGTRSDQKDAQLLADILRTDLARLHPWRPDSLLTRQIRAKMSLVQHLTKSIRRATGRLRANLVRYYPAALTLFGGLQSQITLSFLQEYNTPEAMAALSYEEFVEFVRGRRYPLRWLPKQYARMQRPHPEASKETVEVYQAET